MEMVFLLYTAFAEHINIYIVYSMLQNDRDT